MEVTKVPKKIVTVIEPKRSMTVDKENTDRKSGGILPSLDR